MKILVRRNVTVVESSVACELPPELKHRFVAVKCQLPTDNGTQVNFWVVGCYFPDTAFSHTGQPRMYAAADRDTSRLPAEMCAARACAVWSNDLEIAVQLSASP